VHGGRRRVIGLSDRDIVEPSIPLTEATRSVHGLRSRATELCDRDIVEPSIPLTEAT
jgi:hypothetical protein